MNLFYKATDVNGYDFRSGTVNYVEKDSHFRGSGQGPFPGEGWLHLATTPTGCNGVEWPCRLFAVKAVGEIKKRSDYPYIVGVTDWEIISELDSSEVFGSQGASVIEVFEQAKLLTDQQIEEFGSSRQDARDLPLEIARLAARDSQGKYIEEVAWDHGMKPSRDLAYAMGWSYAWERTIWHGIPTAWGAARAASAMAEAVMMKELIPQSVFDYQTAPWRSVIK